MIGSGNIVVHRFTRLPPTCHRPPSPRSRPRRPDNHYSEKSAGASTPAVAFFHATPSRSRYSVAKSFHAALSGGN
jgi:hypothetical protein